MRTLTYLPFILILTGCAQNQTEIVQRPPVPVKKVVLDEAPIVIQSKEAALPAGIQQSDDTTVNQYVQTICPQPLAADDETPFYIAPDATPRAVCVESTTVINGKTVTIYSMTLPAKSTTSKTSP